MKKTVAHRHETYSRRAATAIGLAGLAAGRLPAPVQGAPLPAVSQPVSGTRIDVRDERILYIADSVEYHVRAYDVQADGSLRNDRVFVDVREWGPCGGPDGVEVDAAGNFYLTGLKEANDPAGPGSVMVFDPQGTLLGRIILPERPVNSGFGGADWKTLYMTARTGVYRVRTAMPGIPIP